MAGKTSPQITQCKKTILSQLTVSWQMPCQIPILNIFRMKMQKYGPGKHHTIIISVGVYL